MIAMKFLSGMSLLLTLAVLGSAQTADPAKTDDKSKLDRHGDPLPPGAVMRLGTTRFRTTATAFVLTPDGRTLYTAAGGRTVGTWEAKSGRQGPEVHLKGPADERSWFAPDAKVLAVPDADGIGLYDPTNGERKSVLAVNDNSKMTVGVFSPDHRTFATGEYIWIENKRDCKGFVRLWSVESGKGRLIAELPSYVNSLAFSSDGKRLYAAGDRNPLHCWDVATAKELWQNDHAASVLAAAPDGKTLCTDTVRDGTLCLWDAETGHKLGVLESERRWTSQIAFSPDSQTVAQGTDKGVYLWNAATRMLQHHFEPAGSRVAFASDGKSLFTLGRLLERWDVKTGKALYPDTRGDGHAGPVKGVMFAPDGRTVVSRAADGRVLLWNLATGTPRLVRDKATDHIPLILTADGRLFLTDEEAGAVALFDTTKGKEIRRFRLPQKKECRTDMIGARLSPDGQTLFALGRTLVLPHGLHNNDGQQEPLRAWDVTTGKEVLAQTIPCDFGWSAAFAPDGRFVVRQGFPELRDVRSGTVRPLVDAPTQPLPPFGFSPDGRFLALPEPGEGAEWFQGKGVLVYEVLTGRRVARAEGVPGACRALAFSPDGRLLAAPGHDALDVWETATGKLLLHLPARGRLTNWPGYFFAECLAFAPDGCTLATGHADGTILVWDLTPALAKLSVPKGLVDAAACWTDLAAAEPPAAWEAIGRLASDPAVALPLLRKRLHPAKIESQWLRDRLADLDSDVYEKREAATRELKQVVEAVAEALQTAKEKTASEEVRRRLGIVLEASRSAVPPADVVRDLRALAVLERIGSDAATQLLKTLAEGTPGVPLTREAKGALQRLAARPELQDALPH